MKYGYIRVSSKDQQIDRQVSAMLEVGLFLSNLFIDKSSGKDFHRQAYQELLNLVVKDDVIVIKSIDRLGRNYNEILEQWRLIVKSKGVHIQVLDFPLLNTENEVVNNLTCQLISDLVLQILSYVSQLEWEQIKQRQREGIREARCRGVKFGRPKKEKPKEFEQIFQLWLADKLSIREASQLLNVPKTTLHSWFLTEKNCPKR